MYLTEVNSFCLFQMRERARGGDAPTLASSFGFVWSAHGRQAPLSLIANTSRCASFLDTLPSVVQTGPLELFFLVKRHKTVHPVLGQNKQDAVVKCPAGLARAVQRLCFYMFAPKTNK